MNNGLESLLDKTVELIRDIIRSVFDTEVTDRQKRAQEIVSKIYTIGANALFVLLVVSLYVFLLRKIGFIGFLQGTLSRSVGMSIPGILVVVVISLTLLRGMLTLFQFVRAAELSKLYVFVELIRVGVTYLSSGKTPTPWVMETLKTFFGGAL